MSSTLFEFIESLGAFGYLFIFLLVFAESGLLLLLPGETAVIVGGVLSFEDVFSLPLIAVAACLGAILGDATGYLLGRGPGRRYFLAHGRLLFLRRNAVEQVGVLMTRYGGRAIFFARFVGVLRVAAPFVAGLTSQPARRFFPYNVPAGLIWGITFSLVGYLAGGAWERVHRLIGELSFALVALVLVFVLLWLKRRRIAPERLAPAAQNALPVEERRGDGEEH
jgi:membrane protein DedA with SNARE-associated domain